MKTLLTVVSKVQATRQLTDDAFLDDVDRVLENRRPHQRARCQWGVQLRGRVLNGGLEVGCLDLVGHAVRVSAAPGQMRTLFQLGDNLLMASDQEVPAALRRLNSVLPPNAIVRVLGCETGAAASGLRLIRAVSAALDGREVFGMTAALFPGDFGPQGLRTTAHEWLLSSRAQQEVAPKNRYTVRIEDRENANRWQMLLNGFEVTGRGQPALLLASTLLHQGVKVSFTEDRRTALIADLPQADPLMMHWQDPVRAPPTIAELAQTLY